ncbi:hypothetical protein M405DRAFT_20777 [Rhizopogon salebrosus TDB-379]|nr:hypothetical protein M405DRAFT_20777 [Rhizopogon salebrosus TDB-379]
MYLLCLVQTTRISESPDAVDSLASFFGRGWEDLPPYQSLNRNTFKSRESNLKMFPISFTQRGCPNDQRSMSKLQISKQQMSLQLRMTGLVEV